MFIFFKITLKKIIMPVFINKNIYLLQNNTDQRFYCLYLYVPTIFYISFKIILNKRFLVLKTLGLYYHKLVFCKLVNL